MYLSPNWMLSSVWSMKHFFSFRNALSRAHHGVLLPTSLWLGLINSLPLATHFLAPFIKGKAWKENFFVNFSLCTTNCSTLARHPLKFATLLSIQFCSSRPWAMRVSCLNVTWLKPGIFSCRWRSCLKRCVCFHSNQYFYVPQENVNVSNEQRVC